MATVRCSVCGQVLSASAANEINEAPAGQSTDTLAPTCSSCRQKPATASPIKQFDNYEILSEVSHGSFGVVYKAKQRELDRIVALKVLLAGVHASAEAVARFQREAKAVAKLKHPNIVPIYDIGVYEGHHYFTMEFVEGEALSSLITKKAVTTSKALMIAETLADAVESAHQAGVIHRDIKPSNILVDKHGRPHITDFGLAKQINLDTKYTVSGTTLGTPAYMPPEQARGEIEKINARSDVYSIGAVMYEMLTGRTPFSGRSLLEVVVAVINDQVKPLRQFNPKIHRDVQTIVLKCLEKDPRRRYVSAAELRDDLRRFHSGEVIRAKPANIFRHIVRMFYRHATLIGAISALLLVVGFYSQWLKKERRTSTSLQNDLKKIERDELERKRPKWRPDWWFPPKKPDELQPEELAVRYKIPTEKERSFQGLVRGKDAPDLRDGVLKRIAGADMLVSAEDCRFFGDVDASVVFTLDEIGIKNGIRIGLQSTSKDFDGIPYLAELTSGNIRLIGPLNLYSYTNPPNNIRNPTLHLEVKAEKDAPKLIPGQYALKIKREGINIEFIFTGPQTLFTIGIKIKDPNLSSWVFKYTQLVVRTPTDNGVTILSAEVQGRYGGDDDPAYTYFYLGEYNEAERRLQQLLTDNKDHYSKARAMYLLALIQEICNPTRSPGLGLYTDALLELDQLRNQKLLAERTELRQVLLLRRAIGCAKQKRWAAFKDYLKANWRGEETIGEPLAWGLQAPLEQVLNSPDLALKLDAALMVFQRLGLCPGSIRLGNVAKNVALLLENRFDDLIALHSAYPTPLLHDTFFEAMQHATSNNQLASALQLLTYLGPLLRDAKDIEKLVLLCHKVIVDLLKHQHYDEVAQFYSQLRIALRTNSSALTPLLISILSNIPVEDQRTRLLNSITHSVQSEFENQKNDAALQQWRLDLADVQQILDRWKKERESNPRTPISSDEVNSEKPSTAKP
ncbi:MAG: protein kinase [Planctomycetota bacterium]